MPDPISVPLAALEHHAYCPRQAALIHVDGYFDTNTDTVRGDLAHQTVNRAGPDQDRHGHRVWHALPVWSEEHHLHGICDTVELTNQGPIPVEHKSGTYRPGGPAEVQLAGQALCLSEMFNTTIRHGTIFAGRQRRRHTVVIDAALIERLHTTADAIRAQITSGDLPPPVNDQRCERCSLKPGCEPAMPFTVADTLFRPRPIALDTEGIA